LLEFQDLEFWLGAASCLYDLAGLDVSKGCLPEAEARYRECLRLYGIENKVDLPRVLETMAVVTRQTARPGRALTLAGAAARIRERFDVANKDATLRARVQETIETARDEAGAEASAHWMKGWNMTVDKVLEWATREEEG
jgi:hypothetical protein